MTFYRGGRPFGDGFLLDEFVPRFDDASHAWDEFLRDADEGGEVFVGHAVSDFCAAGDEAMAKSWALCYAWHHGKIEIEVFTNERRYEKCLSESKLF